VTLAPPTRYLFFLIALINFYAEFTHNRELVFFTKPLLLPLLMVYYFLSMRGKWAIVHTIMLFAFLFSWFGDMFLMFTPKSLEEVELMGIPMDKNYFLMGLGSFLVTQVLFILAYRESRLGTANTKIGLKNIYFAPFIIYWVVMLAIVIPPVYDDPEKNAVTIPVIVYASVLLGMAAVAASRLGRTNATSLWMTLAGACIFVISDSLIALNSFVLNPPMYYSGFWIMTTYVVAEYLIAEGIIRHYKAA
jgi:uncharacterized membrane protein YhhN